MQASALAKGSPTVIVVGVDGSDGSAAALRWAIREGRLRGDAVTCVYAWLEPIVTGWSSLSRELRNPRELQRRAQAKLERAVTAAGVDDAMPDLTLLVRRGIAEDVLAEAARGADLLVVGCRGHGGLASKLRGSVSQACALRGPCPVVIVRRDDAETAQPEFAERADTSRMSGDEPSAA